MPLASRLKERSKGEFLSSGRAGGTIGFMDTPLISRSADVMGGTPVFAGTRVPVQTLLDYIEGGETIDDFLDGFPSVGRDQVVALLEEAKDVLLATAS